MKPSVFELALHQLHKKHGDKIVCFNTPVCSFTAKYLYRSNRPYLLYHFFAQTKPNQLIKFCDTYLRHLIKAQSIKSLHPDAKRRAILFTELTLQTILDTPSKKLLSASLVYAMLKLRYHGYRLPKSCISMSNEKTPYVVRKQHAILTNMLPVPTLQELHPPVVSSKIPSYILNHTIVDQAECVLLKDGVYLCRIT